MGGRVQQLSHHRRSGGRCRGCQAGSVPGAAQGASSMVSPPVWADASVVWEDAPVVGDTNADDVGLKAGMDDGPGEAVRAAIEGETLPDGDGPATGAVWENPTGGRVSEAVEAVLGVGCGVC